MDDLIIAYDLGTSTCKASLYNASGESLASTTISYKTFFPREGYHEQKPEDWWVAVCKASRNLMNREEGTAGNLVGAALSGHSLGAVPLDGSGVLLRDYVPLWSDRRAVTQARDFFSRVSEESWYQVTGNGFARECYPLFKTMWYRDAEPELFGRIHCILGTKDYINYRLTGEISTDYSSASGSGMYNLIQRCYSSDLLEASELSKKLWPEPGLSTRVVGRVNRLAATATGLPEGLRIISGGVDNSCVALGAGNLESGHVYMSLGSSAWIAVSSHKPVLNSPARSFVFDHVVPGLYTSATSIFSAGSSLTWYVRTLCRDLTEKARKHGGNPVRMAEDMADSPMGSNGVLFNPTLAGGTEGDRRSTMTGSFDNIMLATSRNDMTRAVLEGIAMDLALKYRELENRVALNPELRIVGGGGRSVGWRQMFADILGTSIVKGRFDEEAGSLGAAALAFVGAGIWKDFSPMFRISTVEEVQLPDPDNHARYSRILQRFRERYYV